jgi:hypothetical protein
MEPPPGMPRGNTTRFPEQRPSSITPPGLVNASTAGIPVSSGIPVTKPKVKKASALPGEEQPSGDGMAKAAKIGNDVLPFASNIINAFRKPPMPVRGTKDNYVSLSKVNMDDERNQVSREINATNKSIERTIDGNASAAVKLFNQGQKLGKFSEITEREKNTNAGIQGREAMMNAHISMSNSAKDDRYNEQLVERNIAHQNNQAANIANAGDKIVGIRNEKQKAKVEMDKTRVMSEAFNRQGVFDRFRVQMKKKGEPDPLGQDYKDLKNGGSIKTAGKRKKIR